MMNNEGKGSMNNNAVVPYQKKVTAKSTCLLCPHLCSLSEGQTGICGVRICRDHQIIATNYMRLGAGAVDPIEKKPLYHFKPGQDIFSVGSFGCNFSCLGCQNYDLVNSKAKGELISPTKLYHYLQSLNLTSIAFTYSEPLMWYESLLEILPYLKARGISTVLVSNGYLNIKPLQRLLPYIDAFNVDLKFSNDQDYQYYTKGKLKPVQKALELIAQNCHLELTYLLIPSLNDQSKHLKTLLNWIIANLNKYTPLHIARFFPMRDFQVAPTSFEKLIEFYQVASQKLAYVYLGNIGRDNFSNTFCVNCKSLCIDRRSGVQLFTDQSGKCLNCGSENNIIF